MSALLAARPARPYPGLRPFEAEEWSIFFGRERMIDEVIERLALNGLVLIHGASGSGKSSLVRAGVMPKLARQYQRHGEPWLTCAMRPSGGPLWNLATEFAALEGRGDDSGRFVGDLLDIGVDERERIASARGAPLPCAVLDKTGAELPIDVAPFGIEHFDVTRENWRGDFRQWLDAARARPADARA